MKKKLTEQQIQEGLKTYFDIARKQKCPESMQKNLYNKLQLDVKNSWWSPRFVVAGLSFIFVSSVIFNISTNQSQSQQLDQAQADLQVAMHYINRVTFKSLSAVNNKGLKPGLIKPLSRSMASM